MKVDGGGVGDSDLKENPAPDGLRDCTRMRRGRKGVCRRRPGRSLTSGGGSLLVANPAPRRPLPSMSPAPHSSPRRFGWVWLGVLVPLAFTLWLSWTWTPNFPRADHWGMESDLMVADPSQALSWNLLAQQFNDSRYVLSRLCFLALGKATGWNLQVEAAACVLMAGGIAVLAWWMARRSLPGRAADGAGALMALLILSPHQVMNWNFGVQICYFLPVGSAVATAAVFLTRWSLARQTLAGILIATLGSWSFANGWLTWGLVAWGVLGGYRRGGMRPVAVALFAVLLAVAANLLAYFHGYHFQESIPLSQKLAQRSGAIVHYFLNTLGAGLAEGWLQPNQAQRSQLLDRLAPPLALLALAWLGSLVLWHRRDLWQRGGASPAWMWIGLAGWSLLVVALVALARTGNVLSHPFASRYLAFSLWAWAAALVLSLMLPPGRPRRFLAISGSALLLWGWASGAATGIKQLHKDAYTMRLLHGTLTMALVAPEPQGLRANDPMMHLLLERLQRLDDLGYLQPPLVRSPLVSQATVRQDPAVEGQLLPIPPGSPPIISGYAIDHRRQGPADAVVLSLQPEGGPEIWWTPVSGRTLDKAFKKQANAQGLSGEHARIGWIWEASPNPAPYQIVTPPPALPCVVRAYALDTRSGTFYRLQGEQRLAPPP